MSKMDLKKLKRQLGEVDSDEKLREFIDSTRKSPVDLTLGIYAICFLVIASTDYSFQIWIQLLLWGGYFVAFFAFRMMILSHFVGPRLEKYRNLRAVVNFRYGDSGPLDWAVLTLKLSNWQEIASDDHLIEAMKLPKRIPKSAARSLMNSQNRIREGKVRSYYAETSNHRYRMLFVEYVDGMERPVTAMAKTRLGSVSLKAWHKDLWYVGNYCVQSVEPLSRSKDQLLVFSVSKQTPLFKYSMPDLFEQTFMISNYNHFRQEKAIDVLTTTGEKLQEKVETLEGFLEEVERLRAASKKVSEQEGIQIQTEINTSRTGIRSKVKRISRLARFHGWLIGSIKWLLITVAALIVGVLFGPAIASLYHSVFP